MDFKEYQTEARKTALYEDEVYPLLGLAEEVGEFVGIAAKAHRGDDLEARYGSYEGIRKAYVKEAGDVLWMLTNCLAELEIDLEEVAQANIEKLRDRQARGVLKGAGDDR